MKQLCQRFLARDVFRCAHQQDREIEQMIWNVKNIPSIFSTPKSRKMIGAATKLAFGDLELRATSNNRKPKLRISHSH